MFFGRLSSCLHVDQSLHLQPCCQQELPFISAGGGGRWWHFSQAKKRDRRSCFHTPLDTFNERSGYFPAAFGGFEEVSGHLQPRVRRQKVMFLSRHLDEFQLCLCRQKLNLKKSKVFKQQLDTLVQMQGHFSSRVASAKPGAINQNKIFSKRLPSISIVTTYGVRKIKHSCNIQTAAKPVSNVMKPLNILNEVSGHYLAGKQSMIIYTECFLDA